MSDFWINYLQQLGGVTIGLLAGYMSLLLSWPLFLWMEKISPAQAGVPKENYKLNWKITFSNLVLAPAFAATVVVFTVWAAAHTGLPSLRFSAEGLGVGIPALDLVIQALIETVVPPNAIQRLLEGDTFSSLGLAALISIPFYTSNLTALPLMSGLIEQGLNPAVALVFLVAGPTTTLPAMAAVWGLVNRRVFMMYVLVPFIAALITGVAYMVTN